MESSPGSASSVSAVQGSAKRDLNDAVNQLSWDDLRIIKTLSDCGNRSDTAKKLGINVSTVSRRVAQVSYSRALCGLKATGYLEKRVTADCISYRTDSVAAASAAIAAGLGCGFLPCMLGDITPGLVRVGPVVPELQDDLWLLTHQDICKSWRVKAFMTSCAAAVANQKPLIEGQLPLSAR